MVLPDPCVRRHCCVGHHSAPWFGAYGTVALGHGHWRTGVDTLQRHRLFSNMEYAFTADHTFDVVAPRNTPEQATFASIDDGRDLFAGNLANDSELKIQIDDSDIALPGGLLVFR
jgi:hypothetical protein